MARDIKDVEQENPNVRQQNDEWKKQRVERGQDPNDAQAFREHQKGIGAPDPGDAPIRDAQGAAKRETQGMRDEVAGSLKEGAGKVLRNEKLASEGASQRQRGDVSRKAD
ncbi:MAG TPA: hypothetical protein VFX49_15640 [Chloroflexota bacterium]|nr:hypothetical protein [Chloroflexota bacterium]